eukprot:scaffold278860_cov35-Tisochrysis_lutea.AAC.1
MVASKGCTRARAVPASRSPTHGMRFDASLVTSLAHQPSCTSCARNSRKRSVSGVGGGTPAGVLVALGSRESIERARSEWKACITCAQIGTLSAVAGKQPSADTGLGRVRGSNPRPQPPVAYRRAG